MKAIMKQAKEVNMKEKRTRRKREVQYTEFIAKHELVLVPVEADVCLSGGWLSIILGIYK